MSSLLAWFGLAGQSSGDRAPLWHGVNERTKWGSLLLCLALSLTVFSLFSWLLDQASGFAAYLPALAGFGTLLLSTVLAERCLLRCKCAAADHAD